MTRTGLASHLFLLASALGLAACGAVGGGGLGGATPGGSQDIAYARTLIEHGDVPRETDFSAEGIYAEHDLPLDAAPCAQPLCVRGRGAAARFLDDETNDVLVQIGFASNIDVNSFKRKPLNLTLVVDVSGSMGENLPAADGQPSAQKIDLVRAALKKMVARLGPADVLSIVKFDSDADTVREPAPVNDLAAIQDALERHIRTGSATNMEAGMKLGYELVRKNAGRPGVLDRVMFFTDALPNVGATGAGSFRGIIRAGAEAGIGFSGFGVGIDFQNELVYEISHLRGGNYFFLSDAARVAQIAEQEFDLLVTPIATDLKLRIAPQAGLSIEAVYGLPADTVKNGGLSLEIPTVFLSKRRGAIALRLAAAAPLAGAVDFAKAALSYVPEGAGAQDETFSIAGPGDGAGVKDAQLADPAGLARLAALTNMYLAMREAARAGVDVKHRPRALDALDAAIAQLDRVAAAERDPSLAKEADLLRKLRKNVEAR